MNGVYLANLATTDVPHGLVLVVPVGSTEQHGPHLPLGTDTVIAVRLAEELVRRLGAGSRAIVAPPIAIGASGEHHGFAGTLSIGTEVLARVIVEIGRSATPPNGGPFAGVLFVNGHGGNAEAMRSAGRTLLGEGRTAYHWSPLDPRGDVGDSHAGDLETSVLLHLAPHLVRLDHAVVGRTETTAELLPELRRSGVGGVSKTGVLGDPTRASADFGAEIFSGWSRDLEQVARSLFAPPQPPADDPPARLL